MNIENLNLIGRVVLSVLLVAAYGSVPFFIGHGVTFSGALLFSTDGGAVIRILGYFGILAVIISSIYRSELISIAGSLALLASLSGMIRVIYQKDGIPVSFLASHFYFIFIIYFSVSVIVLFRKGWQRRRKYDSN